MTKRDPFSDSDELRRQAEELLRQRPVDAGRSERPAEELIHELQVHQVELELQNEELRISQVELAHSRDDFYELFDFAPIGYITSDEHGVVVEANLWSTEHLGTPRSRIKGKPFILFLEPGSHRPYFEHLSRTLESGERQVTELGLRRADGSVFSATVTSIARPSARGEGPRVLSALDDVTELRRYERELRESLAAKESLLQEVHHRVRNNLQIISSLLNLETETAEDEATRGLLADTRSRVRAMAMIHEELHDTGDLGNVDLAAYIKRLVKRLLRTYLSPTKRIELDLALTSMPVDLRQAVPCGLLLNELISNALKYAFEGRREGRLSLRLTRKHDNEVTLELADDGVGLPNAGEWRRASTLGLRLVAMFERQLGATLDVASDHEGTRFVLNFLSRHDEKSAGPNPRS